MRKSILVLAMAVFCFAFAAPAAHADLLYTSTQGLMAFTVNLHQSPTGVVDVQVTLIDGAQFFAATGNSDGNHPGFAFNLNTAITGSNISNVVDLSTFHTTTTADTGFGTYDYWFEVPGNGTNSTDTGPATFTTSITGLTLSSFVANSDGYYFAADIMNAAGATGMSAIKTDGVCTGDCTQTPEPGSLALLSAGLIGLGGLVRRRKQ
jgi:hypothetical protein